MLPGKNDYWCHDAISRSCPERSKFLSFEAHDILENLKKDLTEATSKGYINVLIDSIDEKFKTIRISVQFQVRIETYDAFFNGKNGYRGSYWKSVECGNFFNNIIIKDLASITSSKLTFPLTAIKFQATTLLGTHKISKEVFNYAFSASSKIWICEKLLCQDSLKDIGFVLLSSAEKDLPKLCVSRWDQPAEPEGLRAPFPEPELAWLELKSGFTDGKSHPTQIKCMGARAICLSNLGWT